jgi:hypothetical protein
MRWKEVLRLPKALSREGKEFPSTAKQTENPQVTFTKQFIKQINTSSFNERENERPPKACLHISI